MVELRADEIIQRAYDLNLLDERQLREVWGELGRGNASIEDVTQLLLRRDLLTSYQLDRMLRGDRAGFFYGDYKVAYMIGSGTFARVYRGVHCKTGQVVGVKVLRRRFSEDPDQRDQFLREGEVGRSLRHPNIVPVFEVCSKGTTHFFVLEFIEGRTLREFLKLRKKFDPPDAVKLMIDVTAGLDYAFRRGITHRDLKASNILVSSQRQAKLVDFGLAAADPNLNDEALAKFANPRTIDYAGLERATGVKKDDTRSDIYFLGCIFYHMLAGVPALRETRDRILRLARSRFTDVTPIFDAAPNVPRYISAIAYKAMELNPTLRYQTPGGMLTDLQIAAKHLLDSPHPEPAKPEVHPILIGDRQACVMVVESNTQRQNAFRQRLDQAGYRVLVVGDPQRALERFHEQHRIADCVIFSAAELGAQALAAFTKFAAGEETSSVPALVLVGDQHKNWRRPSDMGAHQLSMPVTPDLKQLEATLAKLLENITNGRPSA